MFKQKGVALFTAVMMLTTALPMTSFAATSKISSLTLTVDYDIQIGEDDANVEVTCSNNRCEVSNVEVTNMPNEDGWKKGAKPKVSVLLEIPEDVNYQFDSGFKKGDIKLKGDEATVNSVSKKSKSLTVTLTLATVQGSTKYDLNISDAHWDGDSGEAVWSDASEATKYEVRLYKKNDAVTSTQTVEDTYYDFGGDIRTSGTYTFKVRATHGSEKGVWVTSDEFKINSSDAKELSEGREQSPSNTSNSSSTTSSNNGGPGGPGNSASPSGPAEPGGNSVDQWLTAADGSGRWWYRHANGSYTANNWELINGKWYWFDESGWMVTGWKLVNNVWYYMGPSGDMLTGWQDINGAWYYLDPASGAMWANTTTPDGFYVNESGARQ